jgi:uncharacterized protein YraI
LNMHSYVCIFCRAGHARPLRSEEETVSRRRRVRLTPLGYIVLSIIIIVMLVGIYFIIWSMKGGQSSVPENNVSVSVEITPTPSLPPVNNSTEAPTATPTASPTAVITPAPTSTSTPKADDTPEPDVKTPSPSQVKSAIDGKTTSKLNLRKGPGKSYSIMGTFSTGTKLKVYALENDFYFVMVIKENLYGYMSAEFVEKDGLLPGESATPVPDAPEGAISGVVSASSVALRSGPSKDSKALGTAENGTPVYIYFKTGDFYYLQIVKTGTKCYAFADYVKPDAGSVPEGTPVP